MSDEARRAVRICAGGVLVRGEELLLARRSDDRVFYPGVWDVVGGHCGEGEVPGDALVREVEEEIGVTARAFREVAVLGEPRPGMHGEAEYHIFAVTAWSGGEPRRLGAEHSDLRWLTLERALALPLAHPDYAAVFRAALAVPRDGPPVATRDGRAPADARLAAHPEIEALLEELLAGARAILADRLVGLYLGGALAIGDFEPDRSDVDFVAVTDGEVDDGTLRTLAELHARLAAGPSRWGDELEGSYLPRAALRAAGSDRIRHPYIDRGTGTLAVIETETGYWTIQRWVLREHGVVVAGPALRDMIDPVGADDLREAALGILREWWLPMLADPRRLREARFGYRCYAILTMCRMLYTLRHGAIVTKPVAARWAMAALDRRWRPLIENARAWSPDAAPDLGETLDLIRYTGEVGRQARRVGGEAGAGRAEG